MVCVLKNVIYCNKIEKNSHLIRGGGKMIGVVRGAGPYISF